MFNSDKIFLNIVLIITTFLLFSPSAFTQSIPPYIYYQGRLVDQATSAPVNQIKSIAFSLYNIDEGGTPIYQQTRDINIVNGIFSVYLGKGEGNYNGNPIADGIPSEVFTEHSARYLGIRIADSLTEMAPRQLIASAAYAYKAERGKEAESLMGQVTLSPSGNVGIGTTSPAGLLDVGGGDLVVNSNIGNVGIGTTDPKMKFVVKGTDGYFQVYPDNAHNPGFSIKNTNTKLIQDNEEQTKVLKYNVLIPLLAKAVQEMEAQNEALKVENNDLRYEIEQIREAIGL